MRSLEKDLKDVLFFSFPGCFFFFFLFVKLHYYYYLKNIFIVEVVLIAIFRAFPLYWRTHRSEEYIVK